ncbi:Insulin-like growth factor-binding protein 3 [Camelus dromedarius]|uniref:Insulin-like growth factor-binding protein 3 n=1 Tax=Camelus dromedarius TaxID=9838 RepID=A0A5N4C4F2_CAMDR|nr:Insulin-like growth factor-binding protein 3 [Camelus dromedarius]
MGSHQKGHARDSQRYKVDYESQSTDTQNFSSEACRREMEETLNHLKFLNMLSPRGIHIPNCDKRGFYKKKQVSSVCTAPCLPRLLLWGSMPPFQGQETGLLLVRGQVRAAPPGLFDVKGRGEVALLREAIGEKVEREERVRRK